MTAYLSAMYRAGLTLAAGLLIVSCVSPEKAPEEPISSKSAVLTLLDEARQSETDRRYEQASELLERALRIEPDNPYVWHHLARNRLAQGGSREAIQFANKSNTLTRDPGLRSANWLLTARAYTALGDHELASQARQKAALE